MNENLIQSAYFYYSPPPIIEAAPQAVASAKSKILGFAWKSLAIISIIGFFSWFALWGWYRFQDTRILSVAHNGIAFGNGKDLSYQPSFDAALPLENAIIIPSIGLKTNIHEAPVSDYEQALKKGVWRVNDYGTPYNRELPTILAAHRFGYLSWSNLYRRSNSFYNLPKLKNGDMVEIVWRQRKYTYAIYGESEGRDIVDYSADLILYTCQDLASDFRVFRYARLVSN